MELITQIASVAHEANRNWCKVNGDFSQAGWNGAAGWQRDAAEAGVRFHMANPDAGDSASHNSWMAHKKADGWVYGEIKNPDCTPPTHPCMVPFNELPEIDQKKDALFRSVVHALLGIQHSKSSVTDTEFNPSGDPTIHAIKSKVNALAVFLHSIEPGRRRSMALTSLETASMWAVKAAAVGDA